MWGWILLFVLVCLIAWLLFPHIVGMVTGGESDHNRQLKHDYSDDLENTPHRKPGDVINDVNHFYWYKQESIEYLTTWNERDNHCSIHWKDVFEMDPAIKAKYKYVERLKRERVLGLKRGADSQLEWTRHSGVLYNLLSPKMKKMMNDYLEKQLEPEWKSARELMAKPVPAYPPSMTVKSGNMTESYATSHETRASIIMDSAVVEMKISLMVDKFVIIDYYSAAPNEIKTLIIPKKKLMQSEAKYIASMEPLFTFIRKDFKPMIAACLKFDKKHANKLWSELCYYIGEVAPQKVYDRVYEIVTGTLPPVASK